MSSEVAAFMLDYRPYYQELMDWDEKARFAVKRQGSLSARYRDPYWDQNLFAWIYVVKGV